MNPEDDLRSSFDDDGSTSGNAIVVDVEVAVENNKLSFIGDGSFEEMMKERNRLRKEKEEHSLAQLMIQITAAERALTIETQRRIQSTHAIQKSCTQKIQDMEQNFERILNERSLRVEERLVSVQQKVEELTTRFEQEKDAVPKDMEARGDELKEILNELTGILDTEKSDRLKREGRILKQMDDHFSAIFGAIEKEKSEREHISQGLQARIEENERLRHEMSELSASKIQNEMSELRGIIDKEKQERALGDDQIIMALNSYTQQLQNSLSVIST